MSDSARIQDLRCLTLFHSDQNPDLQSLLLAKHRSKVARFLTLIDEENVDLCKSHDRSRGVTMAVPYTPELSTHLCMCGISCRLSAELRKLSWSGIPIEVRATVWQLLLVCI